MSEPLTQKQRIVAHLEAYGPLPRADLVEGLPDIKPTVLDAALSQIKAAGKVDRCDKGWFVAEEGAAGTSEAEAWLMTSAAVERVPKAKVEIPNQKPAALPPQPDQRLDELRRRIVQEELDRKPAAFVFHVKTKSLQISITGDDTDALLAIRAVSSALWEHSPVEERTSLNDRGGLDLVS